jgi:hypothetical protein
MFGAALPPLASAQRKVDLIEKDRFPPEGSISFNAQELVALGMEGVNSAAPGAVRRPELTLGRNSATATALVNFDRLWQTFKSGDSSDEWFYSRILTGEHPISVSTQATSGRGTMTIHLTSVSISGVALSGSGLEFLISTFLIPRFPDAAIDRPFPLSDHIDRIEVQAGRATVFRQRN